MEKKIFFIGLLLLWTINIFAQQKEVSIDFLKQLKQQQEKIKTMEAEVIYTIKGTGSKNKIIQKGNFFIDTSKGYVKLEFTEPIYQLLLVQDGVTYIKNSPTGELKKIDKAVEQNFMTDILQYNFFAQYKYELDGYEPERDVYRFAGYKNKRKEIEVIYNAKKGIVTDYYIIGNQITPYIAINLKYKDIETGDGDIIRIPVKLIARVKANNVTAKSIVEFKNIKINK